MHRFLVIVASFLVACGGSVDPEPLPACASSSTAASAGGAGGPSSSTGAQGGAGGAGGETGTDCSTYDPPGPAPFCVGLGLADQPYAYACLAGAPPVGCTDTMTETPDGEVFCCGEAP